MTAMIYVVVFILSVFLLYKKEKVNNRAAKIVLTILALLLPCLLAALRGLSVGTDVNVYLSPMYKIAMSSNDLDSYMASQWITPNGVWHVSDVEPLFSGAVYFLTVLTKNINVLFFVIQTVIIILFYGSMRNCLKEKWQWLAYALFLLIVFNPSLNMIRQITGLAIAVYGLSLVIKRKSRRNVFLFIILSIVAFFVHKSSCIIAVPFMFYILASLDKKQITLTKIIKIGRATFIAAFIILFLGIMSFSNEVFPALLNAIGMEKYALYLSGNVSLGLLSVIRIVPVVFMALLALKYTKNSCYRNFFLLVFLTHVLIIIVSTKTIYASRISFVFDMVECVMAPYIFPENSRRTRSMIAVLLIYYAVLWVVLYAILRMSNTVPYLFFWQT